MKFLLSSALNLSDWLIPSAETLSLHPPVRFIWHCRGNISQFPFLLRPLCTLWKWKCRPTVLVTGGVSNGILPKQHSGLHIECCCCFIGSPFGSAISRISSLHCHTLKPPENKGNLVESLQFPFFMFLLAESTRVFVRGKSKRLKCEGL